LEEKLLSKGLVEMVKKKDKLSDEVMGEITKALSAYFEDDLKLTECDSGSNDTWHHRVQTEESCKNRGVFRTVIARYYIWADIIQHEFSEDGRNKYRNGNVFRIYPHLSWEHHGGGTNGHTTDPDMIIIEKVLNHWHIEKTLRWDE
jgi:hypothetical protein